MRGKRGHQCTAACPFLALHIVGALAFLFPGHLLPGFKCKIGMRTVTLSKNLSEDQVDQILGVLQQVLPGSFQRLYWVNPLAESLDTRCKSGMTHLTNTSGIAPDLSKVGRRGLSTVGVCTNPSFGFRKHSADRAQT